MQLHWLNSRGNLSRASLIAIVAFCSRAGPPAVAQTRGPAIVELTDFIGVRSHSGQLEFSPDGKALALPMRLGGDVEVWSLAERKADVLISSFNERAQPADRVAFSRNSKLIAVLYRDPGITIWSLSGNKEQARIPVRMPEFVSDMAFADNDGTLIAIVSRVTDKDLQARRSNCSAVRWDVVTGKMQQRLALDPFLAPKALSPDGRHAVFEGADARHTVCDLSTGRSVFTVNAGGEFVFLADGKALASYDCGQVSLWDVPSGRLLKHFDFKAERFATGIGVYPGCVSLSPDKKLLAVAMLRTTNMVGLISLESGKVLATMECCPAPMMCDAVRFSPDGRVLAADTQWVNASDQEVSPLLRFWKLPASW